MLGKDFLDLCSVNGSVLAINEHQGHCCMQNRKNEFKIGLYTFPLLLNFGLISWTGCLSHTSGAEETDFRCSRKRSTSQLHNYEFVL